jgi:hypothetical protein
VSAAGAPPSSDGRGSLSADLEIHHLCTCVRYLRNVAQMMSVISRNVAAIGYDGQTSEMFVRFHNEARLYVYWAVPLSVYEEFLAAPSKGQFLAWYVKGRYPYTRVA